MNAPVDVLAVMQRTESCARLYYQRPDAYGRETPADEQRRLDEEAQQARAAVAELVAADREYEEARKDWDRATASHPGDISEKSWQRIADRFEAAVMRRAAALAKFGEA